VDVGGRGGDDLGLQGACVSDVSEDAIPCGAGGKGENGGGGGTMIGEIMKEEQKVSWDSSFN
jgi:hypothetical protein